MAPKRSSSGNPVSDLIQSIGNEEVTAKDVKKQFEGRKWSRPEKVKWLQAFTKDMDNIVADLRTRLKLKEGERDQRIDELVRLVKNLPVLSSTITAPMLGAYVFDIAVVCKSVFETQQVRFTRDSAARIAMEPLEEAYQEAEKSALLDKREYLSSCFVDVNKLLGKKAGDRMFLVDGSADRQGKPGMFTLWPWIH